MTTEAPSQIEPSPIPTDVKSAIINNDLLNVPVADENVALNLMVSFLNVAQKRGVFSFDESAKIWECIQRFIPKDQGDASTVPLTPSSE
jgi:hypothetical protein